jgi:hypothetical protein
LQDIAVKEAGHFTHFSVSFQATDASYWGAYSMCNDNEARPESLSDETVGQNPQTPYSCRWLVALSSTPAIAQMLGDLAA